MNRLRTGLMIGMLVAPACGPEDDDNGDTAMTATPTTATRTTDAMDDGGGVFKSPCERDTDRLIARYEACDVDIQGGGDGGPAECTDEDAAFIACAADCTEEADCDILAGEIDPMDMDMLEAAMAYAQCISDCTV